MTYLMQSIDSLLTITKAANKRNENERKCGNEITTVISYKKFAR